MRVALHQVVGELVVADLVHHIDAVDLSVEVHGAHVEEDLGHQAGRYTEHARIVLQGLHHGLGIAQARQFVLGLHGADEVVRRVGTGRRVLCPGILDGLCGRGLQLVVEPDVRGAVQDQSIEQGVQSVHEPEQGDEHGDAEHDPHGRHDALLQLGAEQGEGDGEEEVHRVLMGRI